MSGSADVSKLRELVFKAGAQPTEEGSGNWLFQESLRAHNKADFGNTEK